MNFSNAARAFAEHGISQARAWWDSNPTEIGRPAGSALHKLVEDWHAGTVVIPEGANKAVYAAYILVQKPIFLIEHNWAGALGEEFDFNDMEYRLPADFCALEFNISGHRVIHIEAQNYGALLAIQVGKQWVAMMLPPGYQLPTQRAEGLAGIIQITGQNARALAVVLDSGIATSNEVQAAAALNKARAKSGKIPISDYHVVYLRAQHERVDADDSGIGSRKRLHFRRGHYRHFADGKRKTWIRWTLAGDPNLGFIEKRYRL